MGDTIIRLHLKSGDEESDLKGMGQGTWGRAAKDAADRIVKWIARREPPRKLRGVGRYTRCALRGSRHSDAAIVSICPGDLLQPIAHVRAHRGVGALDVADVSASASRAWNPGGSGVRRPERSNSQFRISTC